MKITKDRDNEKVKVFQKLFSLFLEERGDFLTFSNLNKKHCY